MCSKFLYFFNVKMYVVMSDCDCCLLDKLGLGFMVLFDWYLRIILEFFFKFNVFILFKNLGFFFVLVKILKNVNFVWWVMFYGVYFLMSWYSCVFIVFVVCVLVNFVLGCMFRIVYFFFCCSCRVFFGFMDCRLFFFNVFCFVFYFMFVVDFGGFVVMLCIVSGCCDLKCEFGILLLWGLWKFNCECGEVVYGVVVVVVIVIVMVIF